MDFGCFWRESMFLCVLLLGLSCGMASASVVLIGNNVSLSFEDVEANFAPSIKESGECGILYLAEPLDACSPLTNNVVPGEGANSPFVLIVRGGCTFNEKVRRAQDAGFKAAIVFNHKNDGVLIAMEGNSSGVKIHAVFVSKTSGEILKRYAGLSDMEFWIIPMFENSQWSILIISFVALLAMSAMLATCFFVRQRQIRRRMTRSTFVSESHGMSSQLVKAMPSLIFSSILEDNCTSRACAICLEDYIVGDKIRVLPCLHKFHAACVDNWLTIWRTFCPVCKRDCRAAFANSPASECTPLLSSRSASATDLPSAHSSFASPSPIPIAPPCQSSSHSSHFSSPASQTPPGSIQSQSTFQSHSLLSTAYVSASRSSIDLTNGTSTQRPYHFRAASPHSPVFILFPSSLSTRYTSLFIPRLINGSPVSQQQFLQHPGDYASSISPLTSARSLPGC